MQQIFSSTTKVMVDSKNGNNLIYLPLDKLMAQIVGNDAATMKANPVATPSGNGAAGVSPAPDPLQALEAQRLKDLRSRESRDSRDREGR